MNHFASIRIRDEASPAEARRMASQMAHEAGFSEDGIGKLSIAITEAATNQLKHAGSGEILLAPTIENDIMGVDVLALDKGPGIANLGFSLRDGHSTTGTSGNGLGAMMRQSDLFDIYAPPGKGAALYMRFWAKPQARETVKRQMEFGGVAVPITGETHCGDGWHVKRFISNLVLLITDGLGHGPLAAEASNAARNLFTQHIDTSPTNILRSLHLGLKSTRGAAGAVMEANAETGIIRYAGVGNTSGIIMDNSVLRHMVSHNGTLGVQNPKFQEFTYEWPADTLLIFTTDGLTSQLSLRDHIGLSQRHCTLIASVLYRDYARGRDDATVIVVRRMKP